MICRSMTRADDVFDYLTTIFDDLRAQDINDVSLHESQLLGAQNIIPADAMLENGGGNGSTALCCLRAYLRPLV